MKQLDRVTLVIVDTKNYGQALLSLKKSLSQIQPARTIFFTDMEITHEGIEVIQIPTIKTKWEYSYWIMKELWKYITTEFVLVTQWDGYCLNSDAWSDNFYNADYWGAPWIFEHGRQIGNGGFSLRSKRLCEILGTDPLIEITHPEDQAIGIIYRGYLEKTYGIIFPEEDAADKFAFELKAPAYDTFGFHGHFHKPYQPVVVITRRGAMGDTIMVEPVMHYFHKRGYRIVLETSPQFYALFMFHYFKVHHPDEIDQRLLKDAKRINLEMGYEVMPKQLHLQSYYNVCGIKDGEIRNPKLMLSFDPKLPSAKMFKRYVVLHIDERQKGRSVFGVNWTAIVDWLLHQGYITIQIGLGKHEKAGKAIEMFNLNEPMLMRLIGGADAFIGIDSGPFNIALAMDTPSVVFFGSVNPDYIIPDKRNVHVIQKHNAEAPICRNPHCWHSTIGCEGVECIEIDGKLQYKVQSMQGTEECPEPEPIPPCVNFDTNAVYDALNKIIKK